MQTPINRVRGLADNGPRILLVEDDATIARELVLRWRSLGWTVQHCGTLAEATTAYAGGAGGQDLVVLDLQLPDGDGLAWLQRLRAADRRTPVLVLTARDRVSDRVAGLRYGADDYLVKPFATEELDARIEGMLRRLRMDRGEDARYGPLLWQPAEGCARVGERVLELHPREFEVLGLLVRRAPRLVAKRVLVDALAERNLEVGDSAVEVYVSRLRRKLAGSGVEIVTMRGFGYRLATGDEAGAAADDTPDAP